VIRGSGGEKRERERERKKKEKKKRREKPAGKMDASCAVTYFAARRLIQLPSSPYIREREPPHARAFSEVV